MSKESDKVAEEARKRGEAMKAQQEAFTRGEAEKARREAEKAQQQRGGK